MKLSLGLSRQIGTSGNGHVGASCHVEIEVSGNLLQDNLDGFHQHVRSAYVACSQAVMDELARQRAGTRPAGRNRESDTSIGEWAAPRHWRRLRAVISRRFAAWPIYPASNSSRCVSQC